MECARDKAVSLFEMELQAEVDKFVTTAKLLRDSGREPGGLHGWLFDSPTLVAELEATSSTAIGARTAMPRNTAAGSTRRAPRGRAAQSELRRFYRCRKARKSSTSKSTSRFESLISNASDVGDDTALDLGDQHSRCEAGAPRSFVLDSPTSKAHLHWRITRSTVLHPDQIRDAPGDAYFLRRIKGLRCIGGGRSADAARPSSTGDDEDAVAQRHRRQILGTRTARDERVSGC